MTTKINFPPWMKVVSGTLDKESPDKLVLLLANTVGDKFDDGMTSDRFAAIMAAIPPEKEVELQINTLGGYVHEGVAIYNLIRSRGNVDTCVIGYAASIGSVIMQAGRNRKMMTGSVVMIHNPYNEAGDKAGLQVVKDNIVDILAKHTGNRRDKVSKMMDEETYLGPAKAKELGFCDSIVDVDKNEFAPSPETVFEICRTLNNLGKSPASGEKQQQEQTMKSLLQALAKAKIIPSESITDETAAAAVVSFDSANAAALNEVTTLRATLKKHEDAQRNRVTKAVDKAIEDKLVKAERKEKLIAMGMADEDSLAEQLEDLRTAKAQATPPAAPAPVRRGAPPVPVVGEGEQNDTEAKITALRTQLATASPEERKGILNKLAELRGHGKILGRN